MRVIIQMEARSSKKIVGCAGCLPRQVELSYYGRAADSGFFTNSPAFHGRAPRRILPLRAASSAGRSLSCPGRFRRSGCGRRRIAGVLKNRSGNAYTDIQMTFSLVGADGATAGSAVVMVGQIGGHQTAKCEVPDVKAKAVEIVCRRWRVVP